MNWIIFVLITAAGLLHGAHRLCAEEPAQAVLLQDSRGTATAAAKVGKWTIMFYGANDQDSEVTVMKDLSAMKGSIADGQGVELIALIDRSGKYSQDTAALGEHFHGTRLYRITHAQAERLDGGRELPEVSAVAECDLNSGSAHTLARFIRFCKAHYPATHYALIFYSHGVGRSFCFDETSDDALNPAEMTATLSRDDSVDVLVFDVCLMGGIENAYQWRSDNGRFEASIMVAAASAGGPLPYERILRRVCALAEDGRISTGATDAEIATTRAAGLTPCAFGELLITEIEADRKAMRKHDHESWACYDLGRVAAVKERVDRLAVELATGDARRDVADLRGPGKQTAAMNYIPIFDKEGWVGVPYVDLYDLARRIASSPSFGRSVQEAARSVAEGTDDLVVSSFGQALYDGFQAGKNGIYIVFPDGDAMHNGKRLWNYCRWYTPLDATNLPYCYGRYSWCGDGARQGNQVVENWFELLDSWYDTTNDASGGLNGYQW